MADGTRRQPCLRRAPDENLCRSHPARRQASRPCTGSDDCVKVRDCNGRVETFDDVVIAAHADQALAMLDNPTPDERRLLGAFRYCRNIAVLHSDDRMMPRRRAAWASWNYIGGNSDEEARDCPTVTYWMNHLQRIPHDTPLFVTLNPKREPRCISAPGDLRSSAVRFGGDHRAAPALVAARPPQHLVLRRLFRRRASMRTACRPVSLSPKSSDRCGGRGLLPTNRAASRSIARHRSAARELVA